MFALGLLDEIDQRNQLREQLRVEQLWEANSLQMEETQKRLDGIDQIAGNSLLEGFVFSKIILENLLLAS